MRSQVGSGGRGWLPLLVHLERGLKGPGEREKCCLAERPLLHETIRLRFIAICEKSLQSYDEMIHQGAAAELEDLVQQRKLPPSVQKEL